MPGPGEFNSADGYWRPRKHVLLHPSEDKMGRKPGKPIIGGDGKPIVTFNPAAVESITKAQKGKDYKGEPLSAEDLKHPVMSWGKSSEAKAKESELAEMRRLISEQKAVIEALQKKELPKEIKK